MIIYFITPSNMAIKPENIYLKYLCILFVFGSFVFYLFFLIGWSIGKLIYHFLKILNYSNIYKSTKIRKNISLKRLFINIINYIFKFLKNTWNNSWEKIYVLLKTIYNIYKDKEILIDFK